MRPLDSAGAPLGVTGLSAVIPTEVMNAVRSGMEESQENIILFIPPEFFFRQDKQDFQDD